MNYKWQGYIDYAFANDIPLVDLMEKAYQMGRTDQKAEDNSFFNFDEVIRIECDKARADERIQLVQWLVDNSVCGCEDCAFEEECNFNCADTLLFNYQKWLKEQNNV